MSDYDDLALRLTHSHKVDIDTKKAISKDPMTRIREQVEKVAQEKCDAIDRAVAVAVSDWQPDEFPAYITVYGMGAIQVRADEVRAVRGSHEIPNSTICEVSRDQLADLKSEMLGADAPKGEE